MDSNILYRNIHTDPRQGQEPRSIVPHCTGPVQCSCLGPIPEECERAITEEYLSQQGGLFMRDSYCTQEQITHNEPNPGARACGGGNWFILTCNLQETGTYDRACGVILKA